jgi:hypothetical protein
MKMGHIYWQNNLVKENGKVVWLTRTASTEGLSYYAGDGLNVAYHPR